MPIEDAFCKRCGKTTPHIVAPAGKLEVVICTVCRSSQHRYK
jgi:hypothetical protein